MLNKKWLFVVLLLLVILVFVIYLFQQNLNTDKILKGAVVTFYDIDGNVDSSFNTRKDKVILKRNIDVGKIIKEHSCNHEI